MSAHKHVLPHQQEGRRHQRRECISRVSISLFCHEIHFLCDFSMELGALTGEFDHCCGHYLSEIICLCFVPFSVVTCNFSFFSVFNEMQTGMVRKVCMWSHTPLFLHLFSFKCSGLFKDCGFHSLIDRYCFYVGEHIFSFFGSK